MTREQSLLRTSVLVTLGLAAFGIAVGLKSGSSAILFDGIFSLFDAVMISLAIVVARAIQSHAVGGAPTHRFRLGFWHLEPMLLVGNGLMLTGLLVYALIGAVAAILGGGAALSFDWAMLYAGIAAAAGFAMVRRQRRANRALRSGFVDLDARSWLMSASISSALLAAFAVGWAMERTDFAPYAVYVDPAVLNVVCLALLPTPLGVVRRAGADLLLIAPPDLIARADAVGAEVAARHGFAGFRAFVARVGRLKQVELHFILHPDDRRDVLAMDAVREEVSGLIGDYGPHRWLTVLFTADPKWTE